MIILTLTLPGKENQGIYSEPDTIVINQALDVQDCFNRLIVYQGIIRGDIVQWPVLK